MTSAWFLNALRQWEALDSEVLRVQTLHINNTHHFLDAFSVAGAGLDALQMLPHLILAAL